MTGPVGIDASALLGATREAAPKPQTAAQAAQQLEVTFLTQLLQAMRKTVPDSDFLPKSAERDVYDGEFDRAVAEALAARDPLGLVRVLAEGAGALKSGGQDVDSSGGPPEHGKA